VDGEEAIQLQARLGAIEFAICELFSMVYELGKATPKYVHDRHDNWIKLVSERGVEGVTPVESDLLSGELETALRDLAKMIETHARFPRPTQEG
jgi:hypothetical protein